MGEILDIQPKMQEICPVGDEGNGIMFRLMIILQTNLPE